MIAKRMRTIPITALTTVIVVLAGVSGAQAATPPIKEELAAHFGAEVDTITKGDICTVESEHACQPGVESSQSGGFKHPGSVAVDTTPKSLHEGHVYVADTANDRVQELTAAGVFVSMFGKEVNETTKGDICTAESKNTCKVGVEGSAPGQFGRPASVAVDPANGDVYVADQVSAESGGTRTFGQRVQTFTAEGKFVREIGRKVNATTKANLCTEEEVEKAGVICIGPTQVATIEESHEHGAFNFDSAGAGNLLAVGGPEHLLYVGEEHRVQEFEANGKYKGEISLASISSEPESTAKALAVDSAGDVYLVYVVPSVGVGLRVANVIREFNPSGVEVKDEHFPLTLSPREAGANGEALVINALAVDSFGRLGVTELETIERSRSVPFGALYDALTGRLITEFSTPYSPGIAFGGNGELYAADPPEHEVAAYKPVFVAELLAAPEVCVAGADKESDAVFNCTLNGEANPEGVSETEAWFQWGNTGALGSETPKEKLLTGSALLPVSAPVTGLRPNQMLFYRVAGYDQNVQPPESALSSETVSFATPVVPPRVVEQNVSFVHSSSVVFLGELNPEHANTHYAFQYGPATKSCETLDACPGRASTVALESGTYGRIGATIEARGLQPETVYRYRLVANNEQVVAGKPVGGEAKGAEGIFTTAPAPVPQAATGAPSALTATSATVSATVNPDGQPATYAFELGVYAGAQTQYGIVFSGSAGTSTAPVTETLGLSDLQPGTTYAYRVEIASGYGTATGATAMFTTEGLPSVLVSATPLPLLAIPNISFPTAVKATNGKKAKKRTHKKRKTHKRKPHKGKK